MKPFEEDKFQTWARALPWFQGFKKRYGEEPNLNDPSDYDYRAAYQAGIAPGSGSDPHWPSLFKGLNNPRRILDVDGQTIDTKTGQMADEEERLLRKPSLFKKLGGY